MAAAQHLIDEALDASRHPERKSATSAQVPSRARLILLRGIIWALIGLIYAPVFTGISELLHQLGSGPGGYVAAAALAGAIGAALYGSKEVALVGAGVGVLVALGLLLATDAPVALHLVVTSAAAVAALVAMIAQFPAHCARHLPGKVLTGFATGAVCGGVLALVEPLHPRPFEIFPVLAFLVSVNGVLYVASVRTCVAWTRRLRFESRPCHLIETLVIAALAGFTAASVWMLAGSLVGWDAGNLLTEAVDALYQHIPTAMLGGLFGGAVAGVLLEALHFSWVHDV
jgi:hypothetical protein